MRWLALLLLLALPAQAAITKFGDAKVPATCCAASNTGAPATFSNPPIASMATNDYIIVVVVSRTTTDTITNSATGGQTWTALTQVNQTLNSTRVFHARYNGTWSAAPVFNCAGAVNCTAYMVVYRGVDTTTAIDNTPTGTTYAAPSTPFDVPNPGVTTLTDGAMVEYVWSSTDDDTWALQAGGPTLTQAEAMWINLAGSDASMSVGWTTVTTAGASGSSNNRQSVNQADAGVVYAIPLRNLGATTSTTTTTLPGGPQRIFWFQG